MVRTDGHTLSEKRNYQVRLIFFFFSIGHLAALNCLMCRIKLEPAGWIHLSLKKLGCNLRVCIGFDS